MGGEEVSVHLEDRLAAEEGLGHLEGRVMGKEASSCLEEGVGGEEVSGQLEGRVMMEGASSFLEERVRWEEAGLRRSITQTVWACTREEL